MSSPPLPSWHAACPVILNHRACQLHAARAEVDAEVDAGVAREAQEAERVAKLAPMKAVAVPATPSAAAAPAAPATAKADEEVLICEVSGGSGAPRFAALAAGSVTAAQAPSCHYVGRNAVKAAGLKLPAKKTAAPATSEEDAKADAEAAAKPSTPLFKSDLLAQLRRSTSAPAC